MSNNLFKIVEYLIKSLSLKTLDLTKINVASNSFLLLTTSAAHALYAISTEKNEDIKVTNKYKMVNFAKTDFMIVDNKGRHFNVNNSLWYWKWDSIEDWEKIEKDKQLLVKYYGWRIPIFGLFPNIVLSK